MTEHQLHIAVVGYLRHALPVNALWWHTPNGEARDKRTAAKLRAYGVRPGIPDLFIIWGDRLFAIELKAKNGRLSGPQTDVLTILTENMVANAVCRSVDDVEAFLEQSAVPLRARTVRRAAA